MYKIPLINYPYFKQEIVLDKKLLILTFTWNYRNSSWYITIANKEDTTIVGNIKMLNSVDILSRYHRDELPRGILIPVFINNDITKRIVRDITQFELVYITEEECGSL